MRAPVAERQGDGSPEGDLTDGILDQLAKFERAKIAERTRRGRLRRAKEGKIVGNKVPNYGFQFNDARDNYLVDPNAMAVVRRIFHAVGISGESLSGVKKALDGGHVPTPGGSRFWSRIFLRRLILDDVYKSHTFDEISEIVSPQVAARLEPGTRYGVWWYGRNRVTKQQVAESFAHGTRYRRKSKSVPKPRTEWIGVPVPDSGIPREWVDAAREAIKDNRRTSNSGARFWELSGGIARCGVCNSRMQATSVSTHSAHPGYYYRCAKRWQDGKDACPNKKTLNARKAEPRVWEKVSGLLKDPERLRLGLVSLIEEERKGLKADPSREAKIWAEKIAESDRKRSMFQEMAAEGLLTLDELRAKLLSLEEARQVAERELEILQRRWERIAELQFDADTIMNYYAGMVPKLLENLTPQERHRVYRMLQLKVLAYPDGSLEMTGLVGQERGLCGDETSSRRRCSSSR
jgi:site-specific DNA recombinase